MQSNPIAASAGPRIQASEICKTFMRLFIGVCMFCLVGTASAMGSGGGGGGGGASGGPSGGASGGGSIAVNNPLQQQVRASAFKAYNHGVDLIALCKNGTESRRTKRPCNS